MAHSKSAQKRIRQNAKARARNRWRLRTMRESIKKFQTACSTGTATEASEAFKKCVSLIDRTAQKGVIHKNQASRRKSRLHAQLKAKTSS
ncbi:MAG: 30S ribosomal protein S20 [Planctomycetota bacterium]|nr:MAG: 30S ribosomal protein S20 [Planctomycetota bacterium]